jgi:heterogeneous nuclear ribonucleoprotein R
VKTIYVKNLPENASKEKIKELFDKHGEVTKVVLPPAKAGHKRDFGFVHFAERSSALKAVKGSEKYDIDGNLPSCYLALSFEIYYRAVRHAEIVHAPVSVVL